MLPCSYGELQRALGNRFADDSTLDLVLMRLEQQGALVMNRPSTETNDKLDQVRQSLLYLL